MFVAERYVGNRDDLSVAERLENSVVHRVTLSDTDRRRSRVRTETADGRDLGIVVSRDLGDGDVIETETGGLVVVELAAVDALVVEFDDASPTAAVRFGHAVGNRHWKLAVRDGDAVFRVPDTRERALEAVTNELPEGATTRFERVSPTIFDNSTPDDSHAHSHGGTGGTGHTHGRDVGTVEEGDHE